ncbi:AAA domain-containing protein [Lysinibacillus telephonicus]|uniref:AAA domain-containing protein n=1 Tax=Lysinibacillus telephonicus TaxID=1714840 RepID=UPI003BA0A1FA
MGENRTFAKEIEYMDIKKVMVLVKNDDKTEEIYHIENNHETGKVEITFKNGKVFPYKQENIEIIKEPKEIKLDGYAVFVGDMPVYKPQLILDFGRRIRIIQSNGNFITVNHSSFSMVREGTANHNAQQILNYLREISKYTSNNPKEEAFLKKEMEKLTFIHPESILSRYLNLHPIEQRKPETESMIFPFNFNLSQKAALENAFKNSISIIEGPPGTGKTQTILNIIANIVAIQGKSVAIVSNNNEAVKNVIEKMEEKGYGFLSAFLGKNSNQESFFANMPEAKVDGWNCEEEKNELIHFINDLNVKLNQLLKVDRERAKLIQELNSWKLEQQHFEEYYARQAIEEISKLPLFKATPDRILSFLAEILLAKEQNQTNKLLYKLKLLFKYGIFDQRKLRENELSIWLSLQREFYRKQIELLESKVASLKKQMENASFKSLLDKHQQYSEKFFRKCLYHRYRELPKTDFTKKNFKEKFQDFISRFPIILSTTHALRQSIPENYLLDYLIIDESSQVDLLTASLAFSCCRNVVIVGDVKQLPQITNKEIERMLKTRPTHSAYNYFQQNIMSSVISLYADSLPRVTLREHYRCHPKIIEFCNQKYYGGSLIPYTNHNLSKSPLILCKTVDGNHMRRVTRGEQKGNYNQRELDVTVEEILNNPKLADKKYENIGFVTPYRKQVTKANQLLPDGIESDTIHKYQGRQKGVMIMSTVLDDTARGQMGFVDNSQMVNVAVSRAVEQFVLVTDQNLFEEKGKDIGDLIRYIQYSNLEENIIESKIISVFDLLYRNYSSKLQSLKAKMNPNARYKSEEAFRVLLEEILAEPQYKNRFSYSQGVLLRNLLNNVDLLTPQELKFVNNGASLDFVVYNKMDKFCTFVMEVDGFAYHENNPIQLERDRMKDKILEKYGVTVRRFATNGSGEREEIEKLLAEN